jgi:tetratricopeptide (TPR) repeat protein
MQDTQTIPPNNLGLYRLTGFSGYRRELLTLHKWLTGGDDLPAIAVSGEQGVGKTSLVTAAGWNHLHDFTDGAIRVSPAGERRFRLYDVVHTMDSVFGTALTRLAEERWGIGILEQLYRRRRLLIIDKLAGASPQELQTLVDIISHLHEAAGNSRIVLIDRNFSPAIADLVRFQHLRLTGLAPGDLPQFIERRAPPPVRTVALDHVEALYTLTGGRPLSLRLVLGLLLDRPWETLLPQVQAQADQTGYVTAAALVHLAIDYFTSARPAVGVLLNRLVSASGGASLLALQELFWAGLGTAGELTTTVAALAERGLIEYDLARQRVVLHPLVRTHLGTESEESGDAWARRHAQYYARFAGHYTALPLLRWPEVDIEWGNILRGADWCVQQSNQLWQLEQGTLVTRLQDPALEQEPLAVPDATDERLADLRLMREYALALAHYAFWRHPPGVQQWLAGGALAALALGDLRNYAWLLMSMGRQAFFYGAVEEAISWLERAEVIFDQRDLLVELAYVLTDLGTSYRVLKDARLALSYFQAAFDCVAQAGNLDGLATAYLNLGSAFYALNNFDRALQEQRKALRVALRRDEAQPIASAFNNMGLTMEAMDRLAEAQHAYERALAVFRRVADPVGISACYNNLGSVCYARGNYGQALMWYELDLHLSQTRGAWIDMAATLHNLGHVALEMEEPARALAYFTQSKALYADFQLDEYVAEEEEMIALLQRTPTR